MIEDKNQQRTDLSKLGEFRLIEYLTKHFKPTQKTTVKAVGDDAAVLDFKNKQVLISTDFLIEGIHFNLAYMPLKHLGYKAVIANLSDIYAMNGIASQITVSIAASNRFSVEALEELYAGIQLACQIYKVDLIGGDTSSSTQGLTISVTAIGCADKKEIVSRNTAKPGDLLVVTGDLGGAYLGYQVLEREKQVFEVNPNAQPDLTPYSYLVERQLKPESRKDIVELLKKLQVTPTAMIDISDGLSSEILHICKQSKVGCNLYEEKIPLDPQVISTCEEFEMNSTTVALNGGEDYELLFTISQKEYPKIKANPNLTVIGHITQESEGAHLITRAGQKVMLKAQGWKAMEE